MVNVVILNPKLPFNLLMKHYSHYFSWHNRIISTKLHVSPYFMKRKKMNSNMFLQMWDCLAFYRVNNTKITKLGPMTVKSVSIGYAEVSIIIDLRDIESLI